ncbi:reverse transcriptase [Apostichopus japonicus]|uniref:Reverse transcriptase n=1 Tax=Stichopus japonicus TaxID=307972 RepID=A0A2G8JPZ8_STIJA|nr:reverse transcriptase [Apostichopus japonicus]
MWISAWLNGRRQRVALNGTFSSWLPVKSGVPQGSVLGPSLFLIFINDIDDEISSHVLKFADDTKVFTRIEDENDALSLQDDINKLHLWSEKWQMLFNVSKCKILHFGHNNHRFNYFMNGQPLETVNEEKDLGVIVSSSLKLNTQVVACVKRANRILGMIYRTFETKELVLMLQLYKSLVRPHLEFAIQAWNPYLKGDIDYLEKVQRRFTRMIPVLQHLPYNERLSALNLTTLSTRRLRGDLIEAFKIMKGFVKASPQLWFEFSDISFTRGHSMKLCAKYSKLNVRRHFFSVRVVSE